MEKLPPLGGDRRSTANTDQCAKAERHLIARLCITVRTAADPFRNLQDRAPSDPSARSRATIGVPSWHLPLTSFVIPPRFICWRRASKLTSFAVGSGTLV